MKRPSPVSPSLHDHAELRIFVRIICSILVLGLLHLASSVFIPLAFALFAIALVAPVRHWSCRYMPAPLASLLTLLMTVAVLALFMLLAGWGFGLIAQWTFANAGRLQSVFMQQTESLHPHGTMLLGMFLDNFNASLLLRAVQEVALRINSMLGLFVLTIIFIALGMFELDDAADHIENMLGRRSRRRWAVAAGQISSKLRRYMIIRTFASVLTGLTVWLFAMYAGLELATAWGGLAFLLNYIPFLGPLVATVFPTLFAFVQYETWQAALGVFLVLNFIQFIYGSYMEPLLAGNAFSLSPLMVMVAIFFGGLVWGIPGVFIGVPVLITVMTALTPQKAIPASGANRRT